MSREIRIRVNASRASGSLDHRWNYIGYDECNYTHSPGGIALLRQFRSLGDRKSTRLNSSHTDSSRMPSSA